MCVRLGIHVCVRVGVGNSCMLLGWAFMYVC